MKKFWNANEIIPGLWISDAEVSQDSTFFSSKKIGAVVNCTPDIPFKFANKGVDYIRINVKDNLREYDIQNMIRHLPYAVNYIHQKRDKEKKNILVHCHAGMQRSTAVVTGYLCSKGMTLGHALNFIVLKRPVAFHNGKNVNFLKSLVYYVKPT